MELDFKESFIEKLLKDYSLKKIEEKLDLLLIKRNIQSPAGWLRAALKNNYQDPEQERYDEEPTEESEDDKCRGTMHRALIIPNVIASDHEERGNLNSLLPPPLEGEGQGEVDKILSTKETRRRFHLLRQKLMAMKYSRSKP